MSLVVGWVEIFALKLAWYFVLGVGLVIGFEDFGLGLWALRQHVGVRISGFLLAWLACFLLRF